MRRMMSCHTSGFDSTIADTITARSGQARFTSAISSKIDFERPVGDKFDVVDREHLLTAVVPCPVAVRNVEHRSADRLPHRASPTGFEGTVDLSAGVGGRGRGQPERIRRLDTREIDFEISHLCPPRLRFPLARVCCESPSLRAFHLVPPSQWMRRLWLECNRRRIARRADWFRNRVHSDKAFLRRQPQQGCD